MLITRHDLLSTAAGVNIGEIVHGAPVILASDRGVMVDHFNTTGYDAWANHLNRRLCHFPKGHQSIGVS